MILVPGSMPKIICSFGLDTSFYDVFMKKKQIYKIAAKVIKVIIILLAFGFIIRALLYEREGQTIYQFFSHIKLSPAQYGLLVLVFSMMFLNWFLEIQKWRLLIKPLEPLTLGAAFTGVFAGITVSSFTPNRTGEYVGRVFVLKRNNRWQAVILTMAGSIGQITSTFIAGIIALLFFIPRVQLLNGMDLYLQLLAIALLCVLLIAYFRIAHVHALFVRIKFLRRIMKYLSVVKTLQPSVMFKVLIYSLSRHLVFSTQFFLLLYIFEMPLSYGVGLMLSSVVYLMISVVPTIALTEIGVRGAVSIFVFSLFFQNTVADMELIVITAGFLLWLINLVMPAIIGALLINRLKIFS